jgi:hypothetical protein
LKAVVAANRAYGSVDELAERAVDYLDGLAEDYVPRLSGLSSSKLDWLPTAPYLKGGKHKLVTEPPTGEGEDRAETFCAPARPKTLKKSRRCVS